MSVSQGGRSLRNKAPIDYTSCFYKSKLYRDEPRTQSSDEEPVLATRPRKRKQKLSQGSETSPQDEASDKQPAGSVREPLLDRTNKGEKGGDPRKRSKDATQRSRTIPKLSNASASEALLAGENAGEQRASQVISQPKSDDGQPARKRGKTGKKKGTLSLVHCSCSSPVYPTCVAFGHH